MKSETTISVIETKTATFTLASVLDLEALIAKHAPEGIPPEELRNAGDYTVIVTTKGRNPKTERHEVPSEAHGLGFMDGIQAREDMDEGKKAHRKRVAAAKKKEEDKKAAAEEKAAAAKAAKDAKKK